MSLRDISPQGGERLKTLDKQKTMYTISTYTNNIYKKMYQNNYINIPEQYINIIRSGPDENTVIRGHRVSGNYLVIWIKPNIMIGITSKKPEKIRLGRGSELKVPSTKITEDFGGKWIPTFQKLFPGWW